MTTKDNFLLFKDKHKSFNYCHNNADLNLNQNLKGSDIFPIQTNSKSYNDKKIDFTLSESYEEKEKSQTLKKSSKTDLCLKYSNSFNDKNKKRWEKNDSSNATNNSTLSLHISAYENLNEASFNSFNESFGKSWLIQKQKQIKPDPTFVSQNPFEFQRQQNDKIPEPEVSQFKASQQLLNESDPKNLLNAQALNLPNGTLIVTRSKKKFTIIDTLQKSINRAVYVSSLPNVEGKFVIKAEPPNSSNGISTGLKMEKAVAAALQSATPMESERFSEFIDYGESKILNFVVWKRLGPSLDELHQMYNQKFSLATSTRINVQTLRAISKLHNLGFIHRNIQPSHFVVGEHAKRVVYLISFSLCRPFSVTPTGLDLKRLVPSIQITKKRSIPGFKFSFPLFSKSRSSRSSSPRSPSSLASSVSAPSVTSDDAIAKTSTTISREASPTQQYFAPRFWYTSDSGSSLSRLDDIESWLFMSLHFISPETIPWSKIPIQMLTDIFEVKRDFFFHAFSDEMFFKEKSTIPKEYCRFIDEINSTISNSTPNYEKLILIATKISQSCCPNSNSPYDWEEIPAPLLSDYGEFRVPVPSPAINPNASTYSIKKSKSLGIEDPEMDRLVENWQENFRKLILAGVPRAEAYKRVIGIQHPPELATGHWKPIKPKKKKKKSKTVETTDETQDQL